ncbi:hypothetical protein GCM10027270_35440 [Nocardioides ginkgobilobae]
MQWHERSGECHEHILVLTERLETVNAIAEVAARNHTPVFVMTGATSPSKRSQAISAHQRQGGLLVASGVADAGLNLQYCSALVEVRTPWTAERASQRLGRIRRPGSRHTKVEHVSIVPDTLDEQRREERRVARATMAERLLSASPTPEQHWQRRRASA